MPIVTPRILVLGPHAAVGPAHRDVADSQAADAQADAASTADLAGAAAAVPVNLRGLPNKQICMRHYPYPLAAATFHNQPSSPAACAVSLAAVPAWISKDCI